MACRSRSESFILLFLPLLFALSQIKTSHGKSPGIVTYWGQNVNEGELDTACQTGKYEIINIAFLYIFGNGATPDIDLSGHCHASWGVPCTKYASQIATCQSLGVKIFLSLGGDSSGYTLSSADDAASVAEYLWTNYLGGQTGSGGLLGNVVLDGIDFDIEAGGTLYYDVLAEALDNYSQTKKLYLSAAPQCPIPDRYLDAAIKTGLFDYIWIQFYNNPSCEYQDDGNIQYLFNSWNTWVTSFDATYFYVGLPASTDANGSAGGYIPIDVLNTQVIPYVQTHPKFGGIMLWNRYYDLLSGYSDQIVFSVTPTLALIKSASSALHRLFTMF